eukprot:9943641-Ditylum_brightwellii.AAC.1
MYWQEITDKEEELLCTTPSNHGNNNRQEEMYSNPSAPLCLQLSHQLELPQSSQKDPALLALQT